MDPEALYRQLGQLVADMPRDLSGPGPISADTHHWLGRAAALVEESADDILQREQIAFTVASDSLHGALQQQNAHRIVAILHRALARAELKAPAAARGAFIAVGAAFDLFQVIGKLLREATKDVLIVEAYMDATVLTDFAPLAAEGVAIRLLTDSFYTKAGTLQPPVERWVKQYGATRPLAVRITAPRLLHDRLIFIDGARTWSLSQSFKDFARRSPGSVLRVEAEIAKQKLDAYEQMWAGAQPL